MLGSPLGGSLQPENSETELMMERMIEEFQDISRRLRATRRQRQPRRVDPGYFGYFGSSSSGGDSISPPGERAESF